MICDRQSRPVTALCCMYTTRNRTCDHWSLHVASRQTAELSVVFFSLSAHPITLNWENSQHSQWEGRKSQRLYERLLTRTVFSCLEFYKVCVSMMKFFAILFALVAPVTSFSFNGATLRQSTSISATSTVERTTSKSGARSMTMMPIGVPKVAYKMPGSRGGEWVDIYNRLTRERIIFMGAEIDDEMANQIIGVLLVSLNKTTPASHTA